jgi:uncharacterized membrane protein
MTLMIATLSLGQAQQSPQVLHHHVRPAVSTGQAALLGSLPPDQQMNLTIVLPLRNQSKLTSLLGQLYDPASPNYHRFLSVDQFTQQFGPTVEDYASVVSFAKSNGLVVTGQPANRLIVPISGSVAQINTAFSVRMNIYQHPTEDRTFFSPDREPTLNLSVPVAHIAGMNNFSLPHPMSKRSQQAVTPADVTGSGPGGSYLGSDMRAAYYGDTTLTGNGQVVGLLEFGGYELSDVDLTFTNAGQTYSVPVNNVLLDGATGDPVGDDTEQVLDIVQAIGMAPGLSQVLVYIGSGETVDDANIFNAMATDNIAKQISVSWGWYPDDPSTDDVFFEEFAAQGQSIFVASGDDGAFDEAVSPYFYPSEDDYVTAVGGTHLTTNGAGGDWASETAWNSGGYGTGGGISPDSIPTPSWQTGVATTANGGSTSLRNEPDVAMEGDFDNFYCAQGSCGEGEAGTSFAAPRWAGFMALVNQQAVEAGNAPSGGIGFINPAIYAIGAGANYSSDFHDITSGNNLTDNQPVWFSATSGYDLTTGWGSANGQSLIDVLAGPQVLGFWLAPSVSTLNVTQGASGTATIKVTGAGGFSGNVTLAVTSALPSGVTASWSTNPTSSSSVLTLTAASSATPASTPVTITGTSGSLTVTSTLTLAVHGPSFSLSASPAGLSIGQGASATSTITVNSLYGFTGSVNLAITSALPSGVTASWGTNPTSGSSVLTLTTSSTAAGGTAYLTITGTSGALTATTSLAVTITAPTFTLFASPSTLGVGQGSSGASTIFVNSLNGFSGSVNLSVTSTLPSGVAAAWGTNPTSASSTLTFTATSSAAIGQYVVTVTGTSGNLTATTTLYLGVYAPTFILSASSVNMGQGSSSTSYVSASPQYGFTGNVNLAISGLPTGVTASFSPNPTNGSSVLTLTASSSAAIGQSTVTLTGTSGSLTKTTTFTLGVYAPTFTLSASGVDVGQGSSGTSYLWVSPQYGFAGSVNLSVSGLPSGVAAAFLPNPTTGNSILTLTASSSATIGQSTVTVTGKSGNLTVSTTLSLGVYAPTFTLSASGQNVGRGSTNTSSVYISSQYGFAGSVNLSVSGLPSGVTAAFLPNPTTGYSTLTLTASSSAAIGSSTVTLTGTSGSLTKTTTFTLGVYAPTFTLSAPSVSLGRGNSGTSYVYVNPEYGFTGNVALSVSGLPSGVTAAFAPNPTTGSSNLTLTATSSAPLGQSTVTVTGTSGSQTVTTTFPLGVYAPGFTLNASNLALGQGSSGTSYVYVYPQYGFTGNVTLSASGLPSGVTAAFTPNPTTGSSTLTLTASSSVPVGQYNVTITGTSGSATATTPLALGVYAPTFTLSAGSTNLGQGHSATSSVYVYPQYGFTGNVTLSASGLPSGVTASFAPNPTAGTSTITLTANSSVPVGQYTFTVTGTSGNLTVPTTASFGIYAPGFTLWAAGASVGQGSSGTSSIQVTPQYGFTGNVTLSASGLPSGVTAAFTPNPTTGASTLTLTASSSAISGQYNVTITGTSGTQTVTTTLALGVNAPGFTLATYTSPNIGQGSSGQSYVYITPQYGFTGNVTLSASGLPTGVAASFTPNPATGNSMVTLTASSSATLGQYNVTITGTSGTQTATTTLVLGVYAQDFSLYASSLNIGQGTSSPTTVSVNPLYGFAGSVTLSVSGLPSGVTAAFAPNPTTGTSTLTLTASSAAALGQYNVTITGTSGSLIRTTTVTLGVYVAGFTLTTNGGLNIGQGASGQSWVYVNPQYGFTGSVTLSVSGLPSGVTAVFAQNPVTSSTQLTLKATSSAPAGLYNVTITGTSGSQTASTTLALGIYAQSFTLWANGVNIGQSSSAASYVYVYPQYGFTGSVMLAASGLPSGVTASWGTNPTTGSTQITLTASSSASLGQYNVVITGTSGTLTATTTMSVGVYAQSFTLYSTQSSVNLNPGSSATSGISLTSQYGFNGNVNLVASGLPSGVTASFSPAAISSGPSYSTMTLTANSAAAPGTATVTITGTSGTLTAITTLALTINAQGFTLSDAPGELNLLPGGSDKSTITIIPQNGFSAAVGLTATGLPSGVTATWNSNPTAGTSQLTLSASSTAATGSAIATITGTSGALTATIPLAVSVGTAPAATSTTLAIASGGASVSSVASNTMVTLTAAVTAGTSPLTAGQVNFCDAVAKYCEDTHLLGSAQLTSAGTAILKFIPGMGTHSYKAVFVGINGNRTSSSSASALTVTASNATTTAIAQSGSVGNYTLTATVTGQGLLSPTGTVSFLDTTNNSTLGTASLVRTASALSWVNSQTPAVGVEPWAVAVGDFNGDGIPDLVVANQSSNTVTILLGNGDGTFKATAASPQTGTSPYAVAVGDFNNDGKADLAVANLNSNSLTILLGNGDGTFTPSPMSPQTGAGPVSIAVQDFNGDGVQDLAVSNTSDNTLTILLGNGDGTFTASPVNPQTGNNPKTVVAGDFNGDGIPDLAVVNYWANTVTVLLGNGDGTFAAAPSPSTGYSPSSLVIGDFNGDGKLDLAVVNGSSQTVTILLGNGDGTFAAAAASPQTGPSPLSIAVGDFNGDGESDLAVANEFGSTVTILLGNGDGTFSAGVNKSTGSDPASVVSGDFNEDGISDLAVANYFGNTVTVLTAQLAQTAAATATGIAPVDQGQDLADASYAGDSNYKASISSTIRLTAQPVTPTLTVTPSSSSITTAQAFTVTVTVNGGSVNNPTPTGSVTLTSGSYSKQQTLTSGSTTFSLAAGTVAVGIDALNATYLPDSPGTNPYLTATQSSSVMVTAIGPTTPTITVTASAATVTNLQTVNVTVALSGGSGQATPTGTVALSSGSYSAQQTLSNSVANFAIAAGTLPAGGNTLTASYFGDGTYAAATGATSVTVSQVVITPPAPPAVSPGTSATGAITLNAGSTYSGTMNLTCTLTGSPANAQSLPTCSVSPATVPLTSSGTGTTTLKVNTTAASTASLMRPARLKFWATGGGSVLAFVLMFGVPSRRRRWVSMLVLLWVIVAAGAFGCGGGGQSPSSPSNPSTPATTAGSYTFTVTGTDTINAKITASATVIITVQ